MYNGFHKNIEHNNVIFFKKYIIIQNVVSSKSAHLKNI